MSETTLEEHQARVERAQEAFGDDLRALSHWGRVGKGKMILLLSGAALLGVVLVRAAYRKPNVVVRTRVRPTPSLVGTLLRMAVLEAARVAATRLVPRLSAALNPVHGALGPVEGHGSPVLRRETPPALMPEHLPPKVPHDL